MNACHNKIPTTVISRLGITKRRLRFIVARSSVGTNIEHAYHSSLCNSLHLTSNFVCENGGITITQEDGYKLGVSIHDNDGISIRGEDLMEACTNTEIDGFTQTYYFQER